MPHWKLTGDVIFSMNEDGALEVESTAGVRTRVSLEEVATLQVVRSAWLDGKSRGSTDQAIAARLQQWELGADPARTVRSLAAKGLLTDGAAVQSREARSKAPVFLVFSPRSGSNMLRWLLEAHPKFTCPVPSPLLHLLLEATDDVASASAYRALRSPKPWTRRILRSWIEGRLDETAARSGKERWCFRHWVTYRRLHAIDALFGGTPRYVFLVRHGLDVVDAACKVYVPAETWQAGPNGMMADLFQQYGGSHHLAYAHFWREVSERMLEFRTMNPDRVHVVRYEDLVERPSGILQGLFDFLGEECPPDLERSAFARPAAMLPAWHGHELTRTQKIEKDRVDLWKAWEPGLIQATAPIVADSLAAWGYPPITGGRP